MIIKMSSVIMRRAGFAGLWPTLCHCYTVVPKNINEKDMKAQKTLSKLRMRIKATGPITVADYMREVLTNPTAGYYMHNDMLGQAGDFVTSPELGQLFGEMVAIWLINEWKKIHCPVPFQLVELGPGRGSLCQDILRVFKHFNHLLECSVHLVEISPVLSDIQGRKLCPSTKSTSSAEGSVCYRHGVSYAGPTIHWYRRLQDIPRRFSLYVAHEFFDALPIHKYRRTEHGWREVLIDIDEPDTGRLRYVLCGSAPPLGVCHLLAANAGEHAEISTDSVLLCHHLAERIEEDGGIALITDYGHDGKPADTFRAFKRHTLHDPLVEPGSADLTADVDFGLLRRTACQADRCVTFGPIPQRHFLTAMGSWQRLQQLLERATPEQKRALTHAHQMMTISQQMGERFKLLALYPYVLHNFLEKNPPAGFTLD